MAGNPIADAIIQFFGGSKQTTGGNPPKFDLGETPQVPSGALPSVSQEDLRETISAQGVPFDYDYYNKYINQLQEDYNNQMRSNMYNYMDTDLARGTTELNINGKTPEETLRLSRLADRLNNREYIRPGEVGDRGYGFGGAVLGSAGTQDTTYRRAPIQTEETRQAERMRGYEGQVRGRDITRQANIRDVPSMIARQQQLDALLRSNALFGEDMRRAQTEYNYIDFLLKLQTNQKFSKDYFTFQYNLEKLLGPSIQATKLLSLFRDNAAVAMFVAPLFNSAAQLPQTDQLAFLGIMQPYINDYMQNGNPQALMDAYNSETIQTWFKTLGNTTETIKQEGPKLWNRVTK